MVVAPKCKIITKLKIAAQVVVLAKIQKWSPYYNNKLNLNLKLPRNSPC